MNDVSQQVELDDYNSGSATAELATSERAAQIT